MPESFGEWVEFGLWAGLALVLVMGVLIGSGVAWLGAVRDPESRRTTLGCSGVVAVVALVIGVFAVFFPDEERDSTDEMTPQELREHNESQGPSGGGSDSEDQLRKIKLCNEADTEEAKQEIQETYGYYCS
jgi:hypothetical protein